MSKERNENSLFLTVPEAAAMIGMHPITLYRHCEQGTFPNQKICGKRLISRAYIDQLAAVPVLDAVRG